MTSPQLVINVGCVCRIASYCILRGQINGADSAVFTIQY